MRRTSRVQMLWLTVTALTVLAACGPGHHNAVPGASPEVVDRTTTTGATNDQGQLFTAYTTTQNVEAMKSQVEDLDYNRDFGAQIEAATILPAHQQSVDTSADDSLTSNIPYLTINLKMKDINSPLVFQGQLFKQGQSFYSSLNETTGQRSDLKMTASCSDTQCNHGDLLVFDGDNHRAAIVVSKEDRIIKLKAAADASPPPDSEDAQLADQYKQGEPVTVTSTQIFPGRSYFELQQKDTPANQPPLDIQGDLVEPGGDCPTLQVTDPQKYGQVCLLGNDEQGDLLFRLTPQDQDDQAGADTSAQPTTTTTTSDKNPPPAAGNQTPVKVAAKAPHKKIKSTPLYLELTPRQDTPMTVSLTGDKSSPSQTINLTAADSNNSQCPIKVDSSANPLVGKIMADCGYPEVVKYINNVWGPKGRSSAAMTQFLGLLAASQADRPTTTRANQFKQMLKTLNSGNYPQIVSFITLIESGFQANAASTAGALGFWQFTEVGANFVHLPLDQRTQIIPSTKAFIRTFNYLLDYWDGDFKMALASYNRGQGGMENAGASLQKRWQNDPNVPDGEKDAYTIFKDFWYIYKFYMIKRPKEGWDYVPTILAAMFVGADPDAYGLEGVQGMGMQ